jgi:hypothetical protein
MGGSIPKIFGFAGSGVKYPVEGYPDGLANEMGIPVGVYDMDITVKQGIFVTENHRKRGKGEALGRRVCLDDMIVKIFRGVMSLKKMKYL